MPRPLSVRCAPGSIAALLLGAAMLSVASPAPRAAQPAPAAVVARGKYLAEAGDCEACHTRADGAPYAGGRYIDTPFGALPSSNITPDPVSGIGQWSDDDFYRALHEGIGKHGEYLYPVMPFPWYTLVTRDDALAIKAYLFTQKPVRNAPGPSRLSFPYSVRTSLAAWRELFFKPATFAPDPRHSEQVNRGDYLVNGLAHCGECHDSRPVAGTSKWRKAFQGGVIDNWYAPNITSDARSGIGDWSDAQLAQYLKTGVAPGKGIALGPMAEAVHSLSRLTDDDRLAIAAYLKTTAPKPQTANSYPLFEGTGARGGQAYLDNCASCHGLDGKGIAGAIPALAGNAAVTSAGPQNVISVVLGGLQATETYAPMLAIGAGMSDEAVADVTNYVRQAWNNAAPPTAAAGMVADLRKDAHGPMNPRDAASCGTPHAGRGDAAKAPPSRVLRSIAAYDDDNPWNSAGQLAREAERYLPDASTAERVNALSSLYCRSLVKDTTIDPSERALKLGHFSSLVYTALHDKSAQLHAAR